MALDAVLRAALGAAASVLGDGLMATVSHEAYSGQNVYGEPTYSAAVNREAVVVDGDAVVRDKDGQDVVAHTHITFLTGVAVDARDRLTLPDGRSSPILRVDMGVRADDGTTFTTEVWC